MCSFIVQGVSVVSGKLASFILSNSDLSPTFFTRVIRAFGAMIKRAKEEETLSYWLNTVFYLLCELCKKEGRNYSQNFVVDPRSLVRYIFRTLATLSAPSCRPQSHSNSSQKGASLKTLISQLEELLHRCYWTLFHLVLTVRTHMHTQTHTHSPKHTHTH